MIRSSQPIFAVRDVKEAVEFYENVLGFQRPWLWGDPVSFGGIFWGEIQVMFSLAPDLARRVEGHEHYYWCEDVQGLYERHHAAGAPILQPPENKPWGVREYRVRDPNGYHLRFGGPAGYQKPPTALDTLPDYVRIEDRVPTWEEYRLLHAGVQWGDPPETVRGVLEASCLGVTAIDARSGQAIGAARAMHDARAWYSIWDVMVLPEHQARRVGSALIERLLQRLRTQGPAGANVFLFTHSHAFYARHGFSESTCSMVRL